MSLQVTHSSDADSIVQEQVSVPPLFAGPLRDDMIERITVALAAGDHEKTAALLHEADKVFPGDADFAPLRLRCMRLARRKVQFESALHDALSELSEDRFTASLGKFREAVSLSRGSDLCSGKVYGACIEAAEKHVQRHWRFAEALVQEVSGLVDGHDGAGSLRAMIEAQKREERIRLALEESERAEHMAHLPHLRERMAELADTYDGSEPLAARLQVIDNLLTQRSLEDREKNLRRLTLFRDRLDFTGNPQTLRGFAELVSPFVAPYPFDAAFRTILDEVRDLRSKYDCVVQLVAENRLQEALLICDQVLERRPANVLFTAIEEKAKSRQWVVRLAFSNTQRARAFEEKAQYAEALEEWQSLREIDPHYPGLDSEILHCAALKQETEAARPLLPAPAVDELALTPEIVELTPEPENVYEPPAPMLFASLPTRNESSGPRIAMTAEAWNHFKTGLAAVFAVLLVVLVVASNARN